MTTTRNRIYSLLLALLLLIAAAPAVLASEPDAQEGKLVYSNFIDDATTDKIAMRLRAAGIVDDYVDTLLALIQEYNDRMTVFEESDLDYMESKDEFFDYRPGYTVTDDTFVEYMQYYYYMKKWMLTTEEEDILCRIAAYLLMQDLILVEKPLPKADWETATEEDWFYSDKEGIDKNPLIDFTEAQQADYYTLFSAQPYEGKDTAEDVYASLMKDWTDAGITFLPGPVSLITIWEMRDGSIHNMHAPVLIEDSEGLLMIEKTDPLLPYQATKFASREQIRQSLMDRMAASMAEYDMDVATMFVMENEKLL